MTCPQCNGRRTGQIAAGQYFCRDCCVEFGWHDGVLSVFDVDEEGELIPVGASDAPASAGRSAGVGLGGRGAAAMGPA